MNASGEVECDAMIMDGHNMEIGIVILKTTVKQPDAKLSQRFTDWGGGMNTYIFMFAHQLALDVRQC